MRAYRYGIMYLYFTIRCPQAAAAEAREQARAMKQQLADEESALSALQQDATREMETWRQDAPGIGIGSGGGNPVRPQLRLCNLTRAEKL